MLSPSMPDKRAYVYLRVETGVLIGSVRVVTQTPALTGEDWAKSSSWPPQRSFRPDLGIHR